MNTSVILLRRNGNEKKVSKPGVSAGAKQLCFTVLLGSYKSKSRLRSAEVFQHPRVSKGLELGLGNCSCWGSKGRC